MTNRQAYKVKVGDTIEHSGSFATVVRDVRHTPGTRLQSILGIDGKRFTVRFPAGGVCHVMVRYCRRVEPCAD